MKTLRPRAQVPRALSEEFANLSFLFLLELSRDELFRFRSDLLSVALKKSSRESIRTKSSENACFIRRRRCRTSELPSCRPCTPPASLRSRSPAPTAAASLRLPKRTGPASAS